MTTIWTILLFLKTVYLAQSVEIAFLTVKTGEPLSLQCPFGVIPKAESVVWYKQIFGEMPQKLGESSSYKGTKISPEFKASGFTVEVSGKGYSLMIPRVSKEHGGLYYCGIFSWDNFTLSNGTFLDVTGKADLSVSVSQLSVLERVPAGASVTLQCSVLSESRAAELQVLWFRAAPPQSHPQIIYTHHNSSHQCESASSTHTCVYNFSKNILSLNDTGTYYCAVAACGKIIFGNGTQVQINNPVRSLGPEVICFAVILAVCVAVIFTQAFIICKMRNSDQSRVRPQQHSAVEKTRNQGRDVAELNYASLHFNKKKTKRMTSMRDEAEDCVYSKVSSVI